MGVPKGESAFDVVAFGRWLSRYREAEGMTIPDIAKASDISDSVIQAMSLGRSPSNRPKSGGNKYDPSITTLVRLSDGLDLELSYILARAGIQSSAPRVTAFSQRERALLYRALGTGLTTHTNIFFPLEQETLVSLQGEFAASLKSRITQEEDA